MSPERNEIGTCVVLLQSYTLQRLPRAQSILARVEEGERVSDEGMHFLRAACEDCRETLGWLQRHPDYLPLFTRPANLYLRIVEQALINELRAQEGVGSEHS